MSEAQAEFNGYKVLLVTNKLREMAQFVLGLEG